MSIQSTDLADKRIEILREVIPGLRRLAILANVGYPAAARDLAEVRETARRLGLEVEPFNILRPEDIAPVFAAYRGGAQALYLCTDSLVTGNRRRIDELVYAPSNIELFRRAGDYVDKVLKGAKPADIPVQQPTRFYLAINLRTAKALGLTIPESFLLRAADELIE